MATTLAPPSAAEQLEALIGGPPPPPPPKKPGSGRLVSLDAFRGFIMIILAANGFALHALAKSQHRALAVIANQFDHVPWEGMVFWDLIQPSFMFMVGVAMPFAMASRQAQGANAGQRFRHVAWRSLMLLAWSQVIMCISAGRLHFQMINVLSQIAFTYLLSYVILQLRFRWQVVAAASVLAVHWALFALFPGSDGAFSKTANVGAVIDHWLGLNYRGFYVTINFLSSTATTLFGCWTGLLLMRDDSHAHRLKVLAGAAAGCFLSGWALSFVNPMVKRIWTTSFTLASTGCVLTMLIFFYWLVEIRGYRKPVFPLVVVGMNSIFIYTLSIILSGWLNRAVGVFTGGFKFLGEMAPVAQATAVVSVMWYVCYWLYQRRIFFRF
jgi:heparan-alpha-glucosaminide N-acetyltransferase